MARYRMLAVDLDGTLLRSDGSIDPRDLGAIADLRRSGVAVTIITGRMRTGSLAAARACGIEGPIACVEGSHLSEVASGRTLARHAIAPAAAAALRAAFDGANLVSFVFDAEVIHHDVSGQPYVDYISVWSPNLRVAREGLHQALWAADPLAALAIGPRDQVAAALEALRPHAGEIFAVSFEVRAFPGRHAILVRAAGPTKGTALDQLCRAAGLAPSDAVAIGDWLNDVAMFRVAGRSFAMGLAPPDVAAAATDRLAAPTGAGGGIAEAIRRAWG